MPPEGMISIKHLGKQFGSGPDTLTVLDDINLEVGHGEFLTIIGPSGCGKTTLLRIVAGLLPYDQGTVHVDGDEVTGPGTNSAVVFQNFSLLPWDDVLTNVAFGLELGGMGRAEREQVAREWIRRVGLVGFERHYPKQLSGGMQQRVGIARALAVDPSILLMDEPFGSLDEQTRRLQQEQLLRIWEADRKTVLFITHSMEEAVLLGDRVVLLSATPGRLKEIIEVDLPRPRGADTERSDKFVAIREHLWEKLKGMIQEE